jgi:hypothetical protein
MSVLFDWIIFVGMCLDTYQCSIWIGAEKGEDNSFVWIESENTLDFSSWQPNEPNNLLGENCVAMTKDGGWNDSNCDNEFWFVCEMNMHV